MTDEIYYNEDLDEGDLNSLNLGSSNRERLKMADDKLNYVIRRSLFVSLSMVAPDVDSVTWGVFWMLSHLY